MQSKTIVSSKGNCQEALSEVFAQLGTDPIGIIFCCEYDWLEDVSSSLKSRYPSAQIIGTSGIFYSNADVHDNKGLMVVAITGEAAVEAGVIKHLSTVPLSDIWNLEQSVSRISPSSDNTICFEFCTNDEEVMVSTVNMVLSKKNVALIGGSVFGTPEGEKSLVSVNGKTYGNACSYMLIKNLNGKVHTYRENIYAPAGGPAHTATKVNLRNKELIELDHRSAVDVYSQETGLDRSRIVDNVLQQPLGRLVGDEDVFISSMYAIGAGGSLINYKRINLNDTMYILKLQDYKEINRETVAKIRSDVRSPKLILSVNCIYRYILFDQEGYLKTFLGDVMGSLGSFPGYIGGGEQYRHQHVNQTMVCAVFD
ncbi:MAG: hypothetical protein IIU28_03895 [Lachnospiraceae bacterium]|nr:hypothetical protein [Lachnospiraceae bacterium]